MCQLFVILPWGILKNEGFFCKICKTGLLLIKLFYVPTISLGICFIEKSIKIKIQVNSNNRHETTWHLPQ